MKKFIIFAVLLLLFGLTGKDVTFAKSSDIVYSNGLFSIAIPQKLKGIYEVEREKDSISVFHTESEKAGFGGFAFGIVAVENPVNRVFPGAKKLVNLLTKKVLYMT